MIIKTPVSVIEEITSSVKIDNITEHDRDEMAIPSYTHSNFLIRWLMWKRYEVVANYLSRQKSECVFEFGCGTGLFLRELQERAHQVYAMDLFPQYAQALSERYQLGVDFIDSFDEINDNSLDIIIAADVLEHIEDLDTYLKVFWQKLKSDGSFIVSGPTESIIYKLGRLVAGFGDKGDYHHTNIYNLIDEISYFGFKTSDITTLPFPLLPSLFKVILFKKQ